MDYVQKRAADTTDMKKASCWDGFIIDDYEPWRRINWRFPMLFKPCKALELYVACYWLSVFTGTVDDAAKLKPRTVIIVPDGGSGLVFDINRKRNIYNGCIFGVMDHPVMVYNQHSVSSGEITTFAVDFKPAGFYQLFHISMKQLTNSSPSIQAFSYPRFEWLLKMIVNAGSIGQQISIMETFLLEQLSSMKYSNPSINEALYLINSTCGSIRIGELSDRLFISERSLNRMFHEYVGLSPKTLCRISRLQQALKYCRGNDHTNYLMASYESGYFDQSHFIKDFKEFCGSSPGKFHHR